MVYSQDNEPLVERGLSKWHLGQEPPFQEYQVKTEFFQHKMKDKIVHTPLSLHINKLLVSLQPKMSSVKLYELRFQFVSYHQLLHEFIGEINEQKGK